VDAESSANLTHSGPCDASDASDADRVGIDVVTLESASAESAWIARQLRAEHLLNGTPWNQMAVICRTSGRLVTLRRDLVSAQVPVALLGSEVPLREEPAVWPLLLALRVCAEAIPLDPATAVILLTSQVGGLDSVGLRRLRRVLRGGELRAGGGRASDELLVELLLDVEAASSLPAHIRAEPLAVAGILAAGRAALEAEGATVQTVLWALWSATGLSDRLRDTALSGGSAGARADHDLDSLLALFKAAEIYVDRNPGAPVLAFVDYLDSQDLPADSLAAAGSGVPEVLALTPPGAAGREWDVVVVAGVQDAVWPDLRIRDSLLGSAALVEVLAGRSDGSRSGGPQARAEVLADELRAFAVAVSRAKRRLIVTAVDRGDSTPSIFLDLLDGGEDESRKVAVEPPLDLRGVVAEARARLIAQVADDGDMTAARLLAELVDEGVPGADPGSWYGAGAQSSTNPLYGPDESVRVSPSKVELVGQCPLRWSLEAAGGVAASGTSQSLGTLMHEIAEKFTGAPLDTLRRELDKRWPSLGLPEGWATDRERERAENMIRRMSDYFRGQAIEHPRPVDVGEALAVEAPFTAEVGRALLTGRLDRIEDAGTDADGTPLVRVVDWKTSRNQPAGKEIPQHPQLGVYQLAVESGTVPGVPEGARSAGARLVFLDHGAKAVSTRNQRPLSTADDPEWVQKIVTEAAERMAGSHFTSSINDNCKFCAVRRSCPIQREGFEVIS
jgi:RecB family exonuclease